MKNIVLILLGGLILSACKSDKVTLEKVELVGKWKLTEQLADPGDGSGVFKSVNSEKTIEFLSDGTVTSNSSLCAMYFEKRHVGVGTYFTSEKLIIPEDCKQSKISYNIEGSNLVLSFLCIEPCGEKYIKVN